MKNIQVKSIILIAAIWMTSNSIMAKNISHNVPPMVRSAFVAKYPQAQIKKWEINNGAYEVFFVMNNEKDRAYFDKNGMWLDTKTNIKMALLPPAVRASLKKGMYASYYVEDIANVQTPNRILYQLRVDNNSGNKSSYEAPDAVVSKVLYYTGNGELIKTANNE